MTPTQRLLRRIPHFQVCLRVNDPETARLIESRATTLPSGTVLGTCTCCGATVWRRQILCRVLLTWRGSVVTSRYRAVCVGCFREAYPGVGMTA